MPDPQAQLLDLIAGRWRAQAVYLGVRLEVFEAADGEPTPAAEIARSLGLHPARTARLLRALAGLGLLARTGTSYALTETGAQLRRDHVRSLRDVLLLREGPEHYAVWQQLPDIVRGGAQDGFARQFGDDAFTWAAAHPSYQAAFDAGMTSYSGVQTPWVLDALRDHDFGAATTVCDIGGGEGHLLAHLLARHPHLAGTVLDLPAVQEHETPRWAEQLGVADRCRRVSGDMFVDVPPADVYLLKMVLHNWDDERCVQLLRVARQRALPGARLFVVEHLVPDRDLPTIATLFDLHMMAWGPGAERTAAEYAALLDRAGWRYRATRSPTTGELDVVEAVTD